MQRIERQLQKVDRWIGGRVDGQKAHAYTQHNTTHIRGNIHTHTHTHTHSTHTSFAHIHRTKGTNARICA